MPNWVFNTLTVRGDAAEIQRFRDGLGKDGNGMLTRYVPCPKKLLDTVCGSLSDTGYAAFFDPTDAWRDLPEPWFQGVQTREELQGIVRERYPDAYKVGRQVDENLGEFGFKTWYEWVQENWGTTKDIFENSLTVVSPTELVLDFDSAWQPPIKGLDKIAAMFPMLDFNLWFDEPSWWVAGIAHWVNGEREGIEKIESQGQSAEARRDEPDMSEVAEDV